jgi:superfamily I DNA and/or RNA helicase
MIRRKLERKFGGMHNYGRIVEVLSIDNSQGSEKDVVIF